jgi:hypothetical protein
MLAIHGSMPLVRDQTAAFTVVKVGLRIELGIPTAAKKAKNWGSDPIFYFTSLMIAAVYFY